MEELIPITMFVCIAAVAILRPMTKRVGGLLEVLTQERRRELKRAVAEPDRDTERMLTVLDRIATRMDLLEERMEYAERLYAPVRRASLEREAGALPLERRDRTAAVG